MTEVKRLRPEVKTVNTPQCCADAATKGYYGGGYAEYREMRFVRRGMNPASCGRTSSFTINGKMYRSQHAGKLALQILLGENTDGS